MSGSRWCRSMGSTSVASVLPSSDAVFDHDGEVVRFYLRMNNSTRELNPAEMHEYVKKRFKEVRKKRAARAS